MHTYVCGAEKVQSAYYAHIYIYLHWLYNVIYSTIIGLYVVRQIELMASESDVELCVLSVYVL